jgi:4-hydroxy-2-oxoheptanedioate aldolase
MNKRLLPLLAGLLFVVASLHAAEPAPYAGPKRLNKVIELLEAGQPVYYTYGARGPDPARTTQEMYDMGRSLSKTWADLIMYDMEHAPLDFNLLRAFMQGLADGGPTPSGHRTPAVVVTLPLLGLDRETVRNGHWMIQQALACGIHGLHLNRARDPEAVREFIRLARYPIHKQAVGEGLEEGIRGFGSQNFAARIWGVKPQDYFGLADAWPLNPEGELIFGVKLEDAHAVRNADASLRVPGIGFGEAGPRDQSLARGHLEGRADPPLPPDVQSIIDEVLAACVRARKPYLDNVLPANVVQRLEWGVMIAAGGSEEAAEIGRRHTRRTMPW